MGESSLPELACPQQVALEAGEPVLMGSQCVHCGEVYFPASGSCTRCCSTGMQPCSLGRSGTLWSWTVQGFQPKAPYNGGESEAEFKPYGVGYIEMACGVKVEARLTLADPERLHIGMPMSLALIPYRMVEGESPLFTYAFAPAA